jgi:hypothetical protein
MNINYNNHARGDTSKAIISILSKEFELKA